MNKRNEQFSPDQDFIRPDAPPDTGKQSADDFARHLADLLRAEKQAREASAPARPIPMEVIPARQDAGPASDASDLKPALRSEPELLPADLEAELAALLGLEPTSTTQQETKPAPAAPEVQPSASRRQTPQPARHTAKSSPRRSAELQPARLELRPSAQEARKPFRDPPSVPQDAAAMSAEAQRVRTDLSSKPFRPPEEDPSLEELFQASSDDPWLREVLADFLEEDLPGGTPEPSEVGASPDAPMAPDGTQEAAAADASRPEAPLELPTAPPPLSRDTTGPLPTLEELFGPSSAAAPEQEAPAPPPDASASARPARSGKLRSLLGGLLLPQVRDKPEEEAAASAASQAEAESDALPAAEASEPIAESEPSTESTPAPAERDVAASKASAVPVQTSEAAIPADTQTPPHRKKSGASALTLDELLTAAVPIEEAAPPKLSPPQTEAASKPATRRHRKHNRKQTALPVDPASKSAANPAVAAVAAQAAAAPILEDLALEKAAAAVAERSVQDAHNISERTEPERAAHPNRQPEKPAEPVPSADVRKEAPPSKKPERSSTPERDPAAKQTEAQAVLHPEEAYRLYATPLDEIGTRLILTGLFTILSLFFTLYLGQHWTFLPEIFSGGTTVYVQLGLLGLM